MQAVALYPRTGWLDLWTSPSGVPGQRVVNLRDGSHCGNAPGLVTIHEPRLQACADRPRQGILAIHPVSSKVSAFPIRNDPAFCGAGTMGNLSAIANPWSGNSSSAEPPSRHRLGPASIRRIVSYTYQGVLEPAPSISLRPSLRAVLLSPCSALSRPCSQLLAASLAISPVLVALSNSSLVFTVQTPKRLKEPDRSLDGFFNLMSTWLTKSFYPDHGNIREPSVQRTVVPLCRHILDGLEC